MKTYAVKKENDSIIILQCKNSPEALLEATDELIGEINIEDLPTRAYRSCWVDNGSGGVKVDLPKARIQKENEIRAERDRILKLTDEAYLIALSKGEDTSAIEADKVILRDMMSDVTSGLASKMAITTIDAYDGFADIELSGSYE